MKIAIDIRALMGGRVSGVGVYAQGLIKAMAEMNSSHKVTLFCNSRNEAKLPELPGGFSYRGFRYPNKLLNVSQWATGYPRWDKWIDADVFFMPNLGVMALSKDIPLVVTAHDLSFERFPEFYSRKQRAWHALAQPHNLMHRADKIIAVSQSTKMDIVDLYRVEEEKIEVVYSGVKDVMPHLMQHLVSPGSRISRQGARFRDDMSFILYLGAFEPRKNIVSLVQAFESIADKINQDLVLAGSDGWLMEEINEAMNESAVKDRIHRIGFVDEAEKAWLYRQADLFVYPSFYEGFGFPPLEALSHGTPVITSRNSALPETCGEWAYMVNPYDPAELAGVLQELAQNVPEVSSEAREKIREKYSWHKTAMETLRVIEESVKK